MKWTIRQFDPNDARPLAHFREALSLQTTSFTRAIEAVLNNVGTYQAIVFDNLSWDEVTELRYDGSYDGLWVNDAIERCGQEEVSYPDDGLAEFLADFLWQHSGGVIATRHSSKPLEVPEWTEAPRAISEDSLYYFVTTEDANSEVIHDFAKACGGKWSLGVCSRCAEKPQQRWSDQFTDDLVANCSHLFTEAFDGAGYLIWTRDG
jgi:hypothetical protein